MSIRLYNTLTRKKENFEPIDPQRVTMYACGPTVYDYAHIGNARPAVIFDLLHRVLSRIYPNVIHARNITDVDDKIIDRARSEMKRQPSSQDLKAVTAQLAARYEGSFHEDFDRLGLLPPTHEPKATEFIPKMVRFIEVLQKKEKPNRFDSPLLLRYPAHQGDCKIPTSADVGLTDVSFSTPAKSMTLTVVLTALIVVVPGVTVSF